MDSRRLSTLEALTTGILNEPSVKCPYSRDREMVDADYEFAYIGTEAVEKAIEEGKVVESSNYFGFPRIWTEEEDSGEKTRFGVIDLGINALPESIKKKKKYRVFLTQYRAVTEDMTFSDKGEAIEFFEELCSGTAG